MWIVRIALDKPYTFIVLAILLFILGVLAIIKTAKDIFPPINIPVVSVVWTYTGLLPEQMAGYITGYFERAVTTTVNDIEHIESESLIGVSVTKLYFHPNVKIGTALSQVTAIAQTLLRYLPPGTTPPLVLSYNASSVPIIQLVLTSDTISEQKLYDLGNNFIRSQLAVVQGAAIPFPYGGKVRQVQVDLNPQAMQTYGISAQDINSAILAQNLIIPAGTQKIGLYEYFVKLNASPDKVDELNNMPIRYLNGSVLYIRDVAHVRDGFPPQTNIVRVDGKRSVLMSILKTGGASTLDIINKIREILPHVLQSMPPALSLKTFGDQSVFVKAAIESVVREGLIAASLTAIMILFFVGSLRSTFIIVISIPLSILTSLIVLHSIGETINIMTMGGLALAVGILVDDATVAIENINWNLEKTKDIRQAILTGASQIAIPTLVSTLSICIVFVSMFLLTGIGYYLFTPLAEAVIFAMLASYFLSRTLVSTLAMYWLKVPGNPHQGTDIKNQNIIERGEKFLESWQQHFEERFHRFRQRYRNLLESVLKKRNVFILSFLGFLLISIIVLSPWIGSDFFPTVDAGQIKLHMHGPSGMRVEETAKLCDLVDGFIRRIIPANEMSDIVDNIGLPVSGINLSYSNSAPVGPADADILISLNLKHHPTGDYIRELRKQLPNTFPGISFSFLPADMVTQILNFGLPAPIDIQVFGLKKEENRTYAAKLLEKIKQIPGIVDAHIHQAYNYPQFNVNVNRSLSQELGFTQSNVANNMLLTLSGSFQTTPTFWLDNNTQVPYPVVTQAPQYNIDTLQALKNVPITAAGFGQQILGALSTISRSTASVAETHYNVQPTIDIFAAVQDRDLGSVTRNINKVLSDTKKDLPKGSSAVARGQIKTKSTSFRELYFGLAFSIMLIYFLIVVNFQSWVDPFIIITALPAALTGIAWMLFVTHTPITVPALIGAIMCMGVATSNSILVVSFARAGMQNGEDAVTAALNAGFTRLRPVMITALAMILGMLPMAIGVGAGAEENAPLGRAVIGGLMFATVATLFFVPAIFCWIHEKK